MLRSLDVRSTGRLGRAVVLTLRKDSQQKCRSLTNLTIVKLLLHHVVAASNPGQLNRLLVALRCVVDTRVHISEGTAHIRHRLR